MDQPIHLSVVATSRNDNHGGSLTHRMQHFVDGFVAQCKRHRLRAELILVEWNPPADRVPLAEELRWPADPGPCDIRIVTVPRELHARFAHADKIPLYQMLAKNVGIRRARGAFVLATNIDILISDAAMRFMRDRLRPGRLYRAMRVDVPTAVPEGEDFGSVLDFCKREGFRIHAPGRTVVRKGATWSRLERWRARVDPRLAYFWHVVRQTDLFVRHNVRRVVRMTLVVFRLIGMALIAPHRARERLSRFVHKAGPVTPLARFRLLLAGFAGYVRDGITVVPRRLLWPWSFTNACGDFTLLSREDWFRLGGYPEWHIFSWHLDSILLYQAAGLGLREKNLGPNAPIYHIEHGRGSGYTPEGAETLFSSLKNRDIPFLSDAELRQVHLRIKGQARLRQGALFNSTSWGMADAELPDRPVSSA